MIDFLIILFIISNIISFFAFYIDKKRATREKKNRIPEKSLLFLSWCGIIGAIAGMYLCSHKIRKPKFVNGLKAIAILELSVLLIIILCNVF